MLRITGKQCRQKRLLAAWSTGAETAAELYRTEKETGQHKAGTVAEQHKAETAEPHRAEMAVEPHKAGTVGLHKAEAVELHRAEAAKPHKADMRTGTRRADRGKNRKCGSP